MSFGVDQNHGQLVVAAPLILIAPDGDVVEREHGVVGDHDAVAFEVAVGAPVFALADGIIVEERVEMFAGWRWCPIHEEAKRGGGSGGAGGVEVVVELDDDLVGEFDLGSIGKVLDAQPIVGSELQAGERTRRRCDADDGHRSDAGTATPTDARFAVGVHHCGHGGRWDIRHTSWGRTSSGRRVGALPTWIGSDLSGKVVVMLTNDLRAAIAPNSDAATSPGFVAAAATADERAAVTVGQAILEHGIGLSAEMPVYVASLAKMATALAVHRVALAGIVDLDEPIIRWLPDVRAGKDISTRQLLLHRSGLPEYHALRVLDGHSVEDRLIPSDVRRLAGRMETAWPAGTRVAYNNTNYALAAMIVEEATGEPFAQAVRRLVFDPAGMTTAEVCASAGRTLPLAANGYVARRDGWTRAVTASSSVGDGGMWWSGHDIAAFCAHLLVADPAVRELRTQVKLPDGSLPELATGCFVRGGGRWFGGLAEFVGFRAELRVYPDDGVAVAAVANRQDGDVNALLDRFVVTRGSSTDDQPSAPIVEVDQPAPSGFMLAGDGAVWTFAAAADDRLRVSVGDLTFHASKNGNQWLVDEQPDTSLVWELSASSEPELVVRRGNAVLARLTPVPGEPATTDDVTDIVGYWACPSASTVLHIARDATAFTLQRGQLAPEPLVPVGQRDGRWLLATPWGAVALDPGLRSGDVSLARAEALAIHRVGPS